MDLALVLDVDGVIIDPTRGGRGAWHIDTADHFGLTVADIEAFFASGWEAVMTGSVGLSEAVASHFAAAGIAVDPTAFIDHWLETDFVVNPDVLRVAQHWASEGVAVYLGTNQEHLRAAFLRERFSRDFALRDVLYSAELGAAKPNKEFFVRAQKRITPGRVVFVDDAPRNVTAAAAFGWHALHYVGQPTFSDELAALISDSGRTTRG